MFYGCSSLSFLPGISKWNIDNAIDLKSLFFDSQNLIISKKIINNF